MSRLTKVSLLTCCVTALFLVAACNRKAPATQSQTAPAAASTESQSHHAEQGGTAQPVTQTKYFKGSIGSTLGLQMKLVRTEDKLTGNYFYQKIGTKIDLRGTVDQNGNMMLEEFDSSGKSTGTFKGLWKNEADGINLVGNWSKPDGTKQTAFSLHEEPIEFSGAIEIVGKPIKETNKKLNYTIDIEYPQITGASDTRFEKFNQESKNLVNKKIAEFKKDMAERVAEDPTLTTDSTGSDLGIGYTVAFANDNLVSVEYDIGGYYQGAAHPNSYTTVINFDAKNGKILRLADLFKPGAKYVQAISAYSIKDLKAQSKANDGSLPDETIATGAGPNEKNFGSWTITKKGLNLTFDAYQVGPYVSGPQTVVVPYSTLKDLIKPDGPLAIFSGKL
jgi:hypothetical protein